MRDPKRIKRICKLIEKVWMTHPEQRLGQLLSNYTFGIDIFYQEDTNTEEILRLFIEQQNDK